MTRGHHAEDQVRGNTHHDYEVALGSLVRRGEQHDGSTSRNCS